MRLAIPLALLILACTSGTGDDTGPADDTGDGTVTETLENTGTACIGSDEDDNHDTARVTVMLADCLSGCAGDTQASCEATTDGGTVSVTASGSYSVPTGPEVTCPAVCVELIATCEADGLAKGDFSLEYADASVAFSGPVNETSCTGP